MVVIKFITFHPLNHNQAFKPDYEPKDDVGRKEKGGDGCEGDLGSGHLPTIILRITHTSPPIMQRSEDGSFPITAHTKAHPKLKPIQMSRIIF